MVIRSKARYFFKNDFSLVLATLKKYFDIYKYLQKQKNALLLITNLRVITL